MQQAPKNIPIKLRLLTILTTNRWCGSLLRPCYEQWFIQSDCFPSDDCVWDIHTGTPLVLVYKELKCMMFTSLWVCLLAQAVVYKVQVWKILIVMYPRTQQSTSALTEMWDCPNRDLCQWVYSWKPWFSWNVLGACSVGFFSDLYYQVSVLLTTLFLP